METKEPPRHGRPEQEGDNGAGPGAPPIGRGSGPPEENGAPPRPGEAVAAGFDGVGGGGGQGQGPVVEGTVAAELIHELKSAAAAIRGAGEILSDDFPPGHPKREFLDILTLETERLRRLSECALAHVRDPGGVEARQPVDLGAVVREVACLFRGYAGCKRIRLTVESSGAGALVHGEPDRIRQVVVNLLLNALQAAPPKTDVRIVVTAGEGCAAGGQVYVQVEDEGPGIPGDLGSQLFEPFFTTKKGGTGLGLAISRRIARSHGGELSVTNRKGGGASFTLALPRKAAAGGG